MAHVLLDGRQLFEMASVIEHYNNLLAEYYSWMSGGPEFKILENLKFFKDCNIHPVRSGIAVDLGAGPGFQSIPLAQLGFKVKAIDLNRQLLLEIDDRRGDLPIETINADLLKFTKHCLDPIELCVCMGDTLTHLTSLDNVANLVKTVHQSLSAGGLFILTFRDLTTELKGLDRFIPVRSNSSTIFTCFLEFEENHVQVHDLVYQRKGKAWISKKSCFKKLRISPDWFKNSLVHAGFTLERYDNTKGLIAVLARK